MDCDQYVDRLPCAVVDDRLVGQRGDAVSLLPFTSWLRCGLACTLKGGTICAMTQRPRVIPRNPVVGAVALVEVTIRERVSRGFSTHDLTLYKFTWPLGEPLGSRRVVDAATGMEIVRAEPAVAAPDPTAPVR